MRDEITADKTQVRRHAKAIDCPVHDWRRHSRFDGRRRFADGANDPTVAREVRHALCPPLRHVDVWDVLGRVQASLAGLAAGAAWTHPPRVPEGRYRIGGEMRRRESDMSFHASIRVNAEDDQTADETASRDDHNWAPSEPLERIDLRQYIAKAEKRGGDHGT